MLKTKKVKQLEEDICYWKQKADELENQITELNKQLSQKNEQLSQKNDEIMNLEHVNKENTIMRQYYKLDEEPSPEVQAKVLADLRIHNIEYEYLLKQIQECKIAMQMKSIIYPMYPYYWR